MENKIVFNDISSMARELPEKNFQCFNCNSKVNSSKGLAEYVFTEEEEARKRVLVTENTSIYFCPECFAPNTFVKNAPIIHPKLGQEIKHLPKDIHVIYEEIRDCIKVKAYNGAIDLIRKLISHIALLEGARENQPFGHYIDHLERNNIIHKKIKEVVDKVRGDSHTGYELGIYNKEIVDIYLKILTNILVINYELPNME